MLLKSAYVLAIALAAQTPQPFPKPGEPKTAPPAQQQPVPPPVAAPGPSSRPPAGIPTEATLGVSIYPGAEFLSSYDAGRGQRYYLFGTTAGFLEIAEVIRSAAAAEENHQATTEQQPVHRQLKDCLL